MHLLQLRRPWAGPPAVAPVPTDAHPLRFVPNARQWEQPVLFAADIPAGRLFLERGRLLVARYDRPRRGPGTPHAPEQGGGPRFASPATLMR